MSPNSEKNRPEGPWPSIAVVGMAGVFPGASDIDQFWHNIINKKDSVIDIPEERWIVPPDVVWADAPVPDKTYSRRACLIRDFRFNPVGFPIDPGLLESLDPLYHLVLQAGKTAFSQVKPDRSSGKVMQKRTGTILAAIALPTDAASSIARKTLGRAFEDRLLRNRHHRIVASDLLSRNEALAGRVTSLPAALLAQALELGGGSYTLDAACASSLYAVKLACDELSARRADVMLAGGVSRPDSLYTQIGFTQLRALSPTGRCAPFDTSADGLVVGEGVGILALKRLPDALQDGDQIYGLIRGIGLSNDIDGNLLAPASEGQIRAMRQAYAKAGLNPDDIDLIECHGAGTPVGDTTEIQSLIQLWEKPKRSGGKCAIGSVKSMIGHLLTAAGAAGMIKTLLALQHGILPPSLNFKSAPAESPLNDSPFRVQIETETWPKRNAQTPRRAAVSAFGFGGINAHLIFEAFEPPAADSAVSPTYTGRHTDTKPVPIAIVGMNASFGSFESLGRFQEAIFNGCSSICKNPKGRWKGSFDKADLYGGFMDTLEIPTNTFHIPPKEIPDIIPQHLLALKVAAGAMKDSRLPHREKRPRMGVVIGMGFDFETTDFHLRWDLHNQVPDWIKQLGYHLNPHQAAIWLETLKDACGPPLTATRTLGALGSIIGSRIAKEFRLGGPGFVVSCEEASGLKALEIGVRSLQQNEAEAFLIGAVDFAGDARNIVASDKIKPFTHAKKSFPFDKAAHGPLPGEGAAAIVIKRLDQALSDGDRIYAVIKGLGNATGGGLTSESTSPETYIRSLTKALQEAALSHDAISYVETHGSGDPQEDRTETEALHRVFKERTWPCALGALKPNIGHTGAVSGLASLVKTALALYQEIIPPLINFSEPFMDLWEKGVFHIPTVAQYWYRDRRDGPRRACVAAMTSDGNCSHAVLEAFEYIFHNACITLVTTPQTSNSISSSIS
ncbi:MAG: polyketide synthase [Desulfobacterales bacterium]